MSLRVATRRLAVPAASSPLSSRTVCLTMQQRRHKWTDRFFGRSSESDVAKELDDPSKRKELMQRKMLATGGDSSIFGDEIKQAAAETKTDSGAMPAPTKTAETTALVTDPNPRARVRWQRKKVIQMVRNGGRLTKEERIKMTERELLHKSEFLPTSLKKLVMLARQIAGKPIDDAITQMKWSKKKMAAEVRYYLEEARDLAIAQRGMGLGAVNGETLAQPRKIKTRDGKWLEISDPTRIYIAQSWIGRGPWRGKELEYKGRGRTGIIKHPSTSFTVILKEEKTRIREYDERQAVKAKRGPWVHLPNRPIYGQRPYYSW
ncbi:ribosomal protein L22/L17 [Stachybotrys elegans]|uniref:Ribosomal protein L22/L17 n=1 Tax=Stachybotrys elegans TaxID=80388 RepID=A0A8K0WU91_9HYPO|nr:ribosomal protein L22/L17 [Stachybotrys elegans]